MSDASTIEATAGPLADLVRLVLSAHGRVRLTMSGEVVAVVIAASELEELERLEDEADAAAFDRAKALDDGERVPWEDVKAELGL